MAQQLIGPFKQLITMDKLPVKGALKDKQLDIIENAGILIEHNQIKQVGSFNELLKTASKFNIQIEEIDCKLIALPGIIDAHTHICWAGSRSNDYALRLAGKTYLEIAGAGGGIWSTVLSTRAASKDELAKITLAHANRMLHDGITTIEVKSGYGLTVIDELKMLEAIHQANQNTEADLIPTCLAAHMCPRDYQGTNTEYLSVMAEQLLPIIIEKGLSDRADIFIEDTAFTPEEAFPYLETARQMDFKLAIHGDQFSTGGSNIAIKTGALSVDHLEAAGDEEIRMLAENDIIPVVLPGSSIGLGEAFAPARKILDTGASLAIASDWNPGSAPMGDLLIQAAILGIYEKLSIAEILAGITFRAAAALDIRDRGILKSGQLADIIAFEMDDYRDIFHNQGKIKPSKIWKKGTIVL